MTPFLDTLTDCLDRNRGFTLVGNDQIEVDPLWKKYAYVRDSGLWRRYVNGEGSAFHRERLLSNADQFATLLAAKLELGLSAREADQNPLVLAARTFRRQYLPKVMEDTNARVHRFVTHLLSVQLGGGITPEALDDPINEGYLQFAVDAHLYHRYKQHRTDAPSVIEGHIMIRVSNVYERWSKVKDALYPDGKVNGEHMHSVGWDPTPAQETRELSPGDRLDPRDWGERDLVTFCCWADPIEATASGVHAWIELWEKTGDIYTLQAFYNPQKAGADTSEKMKVGDVTLQRIDISRFFPVRDPRYSKSQSRLHLIQWGPVTAKEKESLKAKALWELQHPQEKFYSITDSTCIHSANSFAQLTGVHLPAKISLYDIVLGSVKQKAQSGMRSYLPDRIAAVVNRAFSWMASGWNDTVRYVPERVRIPVRTVFRVPIGLTINLIAYGCLGAGKITEQAKEHGGKPVFTSRWDVLDYERLLTLVHPNQIVKVVKPSIDKWRAEREAEIQLWVDDWTDIKAKYPDYEGAAAIDEVLKRCLRWCEFRKPNSEWLKWHKEQLKSGDSLVGDAVKLVGDAFSVRQKVTVDDWIDGAQAILGTSSFWEEPLQVLFADLRNMASDKEDAA
jgi:hypothetical protein